jgi:hypothetical protein
MKRTLIGSLALVLGTGAAALTTDAVPVAAEGGDAVLAWNEITSQAAVRSGISPLVNPLHESRMFAMVHIAIHDALNGIERRSRPYAVDLRLVRDASPDAAVAAAAHGVLVPVLRELPPEFAAGIEPAVDYVEDQYDAALAAIPDGVAERRGIALGNAAAGMIVASRLDDGSDTPFLDTDEIAPVPGHFQWVVGLPFNAAPGWADVEPFVMSHPAQFRPRPPDALTSRRYAADVNEVKALGAIDSDTRTDDQTEAAFFWFESSPLRWNRIARTASAAVGLDLWTNARLFGLLNVASADGYIGNWDSKRHYDRWRPETAIRQAHTDGNPATERDGEWVPLWGSSGATPEYDSGHAIEGAAAAVVLADVFGTDDISFAVCSYSFQERDREKNCDGATPVYRTYESFSEAARENGLSRIWLGWHMRHSVEIGYEHGERIGHRALHREFRTID